MRHLWKMVEIGITLWMGLVSKQPEIDQISSVIDIKMDVCADISLNHE